jgi:phospholipase D1/2
MQQNTQIYRTVFGCYPDNNIRHYEDISALKKKATPQRYNELIPSLRGHAVDFPIYFLERENLGAKAGKKEAMAPKITLT